MKIALADNNGLKFTKDLKEHWEKKHEVRYERGASEFLAQWADIYYVDTWDNNIHYLYKLYHGLHDQMPPDWDNNQKPRIVVRALDWEVWIGLARDQKMIDWVDDIIVIAPHIEEELRKHADFKDKIHLIRPGVNLDTFTLKTKKTDGFQLGMVLGDMWKYKNHMGGLDIFTTLFNQDKRWRLHVRGQHENSTYDPINWDYYLRSRGIAEAVTLYSSVNDMNEWYENIDILLHPGQKEAFCYAVGEAMAKGIPVVVNDFYGSHDIWANKFGVVTGGFNLLYKTNKEAIQNIKYTDPNLERSSMRKFIKENYDIKRMMSEYDQLLGI